MQLKWLKCNETVSLLCNCLAGMIILCFDPLHLTTQWEYHLTKTVQNKGTQPLSEICIDKWIVC